MLPHERQVKLFIPLFISVSSKDELIDMQQTSTCFLFAAPSSPPQNVTAIAVSSTLAELFWLPPPSEHQNGIIHEYSVIKVTLPSGHLEELTAVDATISFDGLHPYTPYIFVVAAKTVALGPFSDQVKLEMPEESRSYMLYCTAYTTVVMGCIYYDVHIFTI